VVVLSRPDQPRMIYCPGCFGKLLGTPPEDAEPDDD
jgi:hypothetical protein